MVALAVLPEMLVTINFRVPGSWLSVEAQMEISAGLLEEEATSWSPK